ncbi:iron chaperone [Lacticaseibacillus songhuajiangensis]|jgi:uncharacterized protein YdhG (YjbR/CyaY superfamily)|uniref:iron chaperone n=1 Tax=Lacticaseibacillus songhuajiangensis TaxID=1296539 RepID=UPI000F76E620|nr:DUF1801 domain-containing protein [Lacticaseibacillus songhuajiangensis]
MSVIDDYIAAAAPAKQERLRAVYATLRAELPDATEKISYGMPTFWQGHNLIHFAAFKAHIGIYPGADGMAHFAQEVAAYPHSKGALQLPDDRELPLELVAAMARYRLAVETSKMK